MADDWNVPAAGSSLFRLNSCFLCDWNCTHSYTPVLHLQPMWECHHLFLILGVHSIQKPVRKISELFSLLTCVQIQFLCFPGSDMFPRTCEVQFSWRSNERTMQCSCSLLSVHMHIVPIFDSEQSNLTLSTRRSTRGHQWFHQRIQQRGHQGGQQRIYWEDVLQVQHTEMTLWQRLDLVVISLSLNSSKNIFLHFADFSKHRGFSFCCIKNHSHVLFCGCTAGV